MRLEPLYRVRFSYPEGWSVGLEGGWEQHLYFAEGRCEGSITGRFRGANFPQRRTTEGPFQPDFRAVIETDDGAAVMFECHGYGPFLYSDVLSTTQSLQGKSGREAERLADRNIA